MVEIKIIPVSEFGRVRQATLDKFDKLALMADMCRANTLAEVKRAGSGHLGSSFSAMEIVALLYFSEMNVAELGIDHPDRDIYFSSKGHDVPGLYSVLYSLGILPPDQLMKLRRIDGPCGHPDVGTPGIEVNSGSLGMGISKGKGMAFAKSLAGRGGRIFVMTGDGELQEGQIYETLQSAVHQKITNLNVIVDHNKVQSDKPVSEIVSLGDLEAKFRAFGWHVARCDGHDLRALDRALTEFKTIADKPKILIADTIKGRGVSFMEHPQALADGKGFYRWHSGAPDDVSFAAGYEEIVNRINDRLAGFGLSPLVLEVVPPEGQAASPRNALGEPVSAGGEVKKASAVSNEYVVEAFGQALVEVAAERKDLVVLDADLSADCRLRKFEFTYPDRFIENGIAEQDMVSMAGGLARQGLLPVVNTFASFLAARANEQIYNNACERTRIIYVNHYSGVIPAGPGQSHQSIRDISLLGSLPNFVILQPANAAETRMAVEYCVNEATDNCVLRLIISPSPRLLELPADYRLTFGRGVALTEGTDAVLFAYGPVMIHEALVAAERLAERGFGLRVINMPWLNRVDAAWLNQTLEGMYSIYVLEDHAPVGGLGDSLLNVMAANGLMNGRRFEKFGIEGYPAWGTPSEALKFHGVDGASVAERILRNEA
jgi:transketolase